MSTIPAVLTELADALSGRDFYETLSNALRLSQAERELLRALADAPEGLSIRELRVRAPAVWAPGPVSRSLNKKLRAASLRAAVVLAECKRSGGGLSSSLWRLVEFSCGTAG